MEGIKKMKLDETVNPTLFSTLDEETQTSILEQKSIIFQGQETNLKELLSPLTKFDLDDIIDSEVLLKISRNEKISVGRNVEPLEGRDKIPYIPQCIRKTYFLDRTKITIDELSQLGKFDHKDFVTIGGATGTGKSTFLTSLANAIKQKNPNLWVLKVDLSRYMKSFQKFKEDNLKPVTLLDLLNSKPESRLRSDFEKKIFLIPDKVIILLDALDEVCLEYKDMVVEIIRDCKSRSRNGPFVNYAVNFLVLAGSNHLDKETGYELTHTMEPFSLRDQINFLKEYWTQKCELSEDEIKKFETSVEAAVRQSWYKETPLGMPLLLRLLAEILGNKDSFGTDTYAWEGHHLIKQLTLTELFQTYVYSNCSRNTRIELSTVRNDIANINSDCNNYLHILALETVFDVSICKHFSCYKTRIAEVPQEKLVTFGILKKIDNEFIFAHRTFAEYFVTECISNELSNYQNEPFLKFFCQNILPSYRHKVVRAFLNSFLLTDSNALPKETLIHIANAVTPTDYNFLLYTSASEGLLELLKLLFKCCQVADITIDTSSIRVGMNHALHHAARGGHFEVVKFLIENGTPVDVRNEKDRTALHLAAKIGSLPMVKFLVERGIEVDCKDAKGHTALHEASRKGSFEMVKFLLENGAYINSRDRDGYTALHIAAWMGDFDRVKYLVDRGADIHSRGERGTVISHAVLSGNLDIVEFLVEKGADVTVRTKSGGTLLQVLPDWDENTSMENVIEAWKVLSAKGVDINTVLHKAIKAGYKVEYIRFLVEQGADVNKDYLINEALYRNDVEILKYLMDNGAIFNANHNQNENLYDAIRYHRIDVVRHMAERGISLDITNEGGHPALNIVVDNNDYEMIKVLVENNVRIDEPNVLRLALRKCNFEVVKFLVESGANAKIDFGDVESSDLESVKFLLDRGATFRNFYDVGGNLELLKYLFHNGIDVDKSNIFSNAAENGNLCIVKFLLEKGVDVNEKNREKDAPLHLATKRNHVHVIKCLLENGADIEVKDRDDHTALYVATSEGCLEAAKVLLERGANVQSVTSNDRSALRDAMQAGYIETIKYLVEQGAPIDVEEEYVGPLWSLALNFELLEVAEMMTERDPKYMCKLEEAVQRLINDTETKEDNTILETVFHSVNVMKYLIEKGVDFTPRVIDKYKFFICAVSKGDFKLVKYLIEKGCDVNVTDYCDTTALHKTTDLNMAKLLIGNGANVNAKDRYGKSVLHRAIEKSNLDMCKLLIENGADINEEDDAGRTLLHMKRYEWGFISIDKIKYLVKQGIKPKLTKDGRNVLQDAVATSHVDLDMVKYLLSLGQDVNCRDKKGGTPLDDAIAQGDLDVVRLLVENGAEVDRDTTAKSGVLFNAIRSHHYGGWDCSLDMVKYLVSKGANVNATGDNGNTMLCYAIYENNLELVKFLIDSGADINAVDENGYSPLLKASTSNNFHLMKYLIDSGASLDTKTAACRTLLHEAASTGSYPAVKFLLENGADVNVRDKDGRTPLHDIAANCHSYFGITESFNVLKLLIEKGAEVNAKTRNGCTPLHEAVSSGQENKIKFLIEKGADLNAKDEYGRTPLLTVVTKKRSRHIMGHHEKNIAKILINSGANINEKSDSGRTVLHEAAILGNLEMVKHLVELGADLNSVSLNGGTPLHDAAKRGRLEVVEFLVQKGADIHVKNKKGNTALEEARNGNHGDIVELLAKLV